MEEIFTGGSRVRRLCLRVGVDGVEVVEEAVDEAPPSKKPVKQLVAVREAAAEAEAAARVKTPTPPEGLVLLGFLTIPPLREWPEDGDAAPGGGRGGRKCS